MAEDVDPDKMLVTCARTNKPFTVDLSGKGSGCIDPTAYCKHRTACPAAFIKRDGAGVPKAADGGEGRA